MVRHSPILFLVPLLALAAACVEQVAPTITSTPVTSAVEGKAYSYTIAVTGEPAPTLTGTTLPAWLSLQDGVLSGTPSAADVGNHEVTLTASNDVSPNAVQSFSIEVLAETVAPTFTSQAKTEATEGVRYTYTVAASGKPAPAITATKLPDWLTFEANVLSGTPDYAHGGEHEVVLTARNGIDPDAVQSFTITVDTVSAAPEFTSTAITTATENQAYSYTVAVSGTPTPTVSATTLPEWLTFDPTTKTLSGTPVYEDGGNHQVTLKASNGISPAAMHTFTITVATVSTAPFFTSTPNTAATEGQPYAYTVTTAAIPDATVTATTLPSWMTFDGEVLLGAPTYAQGGDHQVVLTASNGISPNAVQSFTVTVTTVSVAPVITSTPVITVEEASPYSYTVSATGTPAPTFSATGAAGAALPSWLSINATTGVLSGTPGNADVGSHSVVVKAANGISPDAEQTFTIEVIPLPVAPTITSTALTRAVEGQLYSYAVSATGVPAPSFTASLAGGGALPTWLSMNATSGVLSGTPAAADIGTLQLEVTASNGLQPDSVQAFTLTVASAAVTITSSAPTTAQVGTPYTYTVTTSGSPAPTLSVTGLPAWLTFDGTDTISGTPTAAGTTGTITVTATNGMSTQGKQTFSITVALPPGLPLAGSPYHEDFDNGLPTGWRTNGTVWGFGVPTTGTAAEGPPSVVDGPVAATNPTGLYTNSMNASLITQHFDLTGVTDPVLKFAHWYNFEMSSSGTSRYDGANIKISTDGGATWSALVSGSVTPSYTGPITTSTNWMNTQPVWTGILSDWETVTVDLGANLAGLPLTHVALRFDVGSDGSTTRPGWYIDALRIGAASELPAAPMITSTSPSTSLFEGQPYSYTVVTTGSPAPTLTATGVNGAALPAWLSFDPTTGLLSGVPGAANAGSHTVVISADNGEPPAKRQTLVFAVTATEVIGDFTFEGSSVQPVSAATHVAVSGVTTANGVTTFPGGNGGGTALSSNGFNDAATPNSFEFTVTPDASWEFIAAELSFDHYRSGTGPTQFEVSRLVNGVETVLANGARTVPTATTWTTEQVFFIPSEHGPIREPITFRITGKDASAAGGTWRIDNLRFRGVIDPQPMPAAITSTAVTTASTGALYTYAVTTSGHPAPTITTSGRPSWLKFDPATNTLSGVPGVANLGTSGTITVTATNGVGSAATQTFTISVTPGAPVAVPNGSPVVEGFGTSLPAGWSFTGDWEFGVPRTGAASDGPPSLWNGEVAATKLNGNYSSSTNSRLLTPVLDLTGVTSPRLEFMHWYNFEQSTNGSRWDGANVKISTDGGATFTALLPSSVTPAYPGSLAGSSMSGQQGWGGLLPDWEAVTVDLEANLAGKPLNQVVLRFDMASDSSTNRPGWYVDDVKIGAAADL